MASVYAEEHSLVTRVEIKRSKFSGLREDKTAFEVVSHWTTEGHDASQNTQQTVWRTYADFKNLHKQLKTSAAFVAEFPKSQWIHSLSTSNRDLADIRRCLLDSYMQSVLAQAGNSVALRSFVLPAQRPDWPDAVGAIDLNRHDCPHDSSATEWWYLNTHFEDDEGNAYSAFAAFFRVIKHIDADSGAKSHAHALNWAMSDVSGKRYFQESVLDPDSSKIIQKQLDTGRVIKDGRLRRAYEEVLAKGNVPLPDRMFTKGRDARVAKDTLNLDYESATLTKDDRGRYVLRCTMPSGATSVNLTFTPEKAPIRHGLNGVVKGHDGDDMFYYFIPRCKVTGTFTVDGKQKTVRKGQGWYDHEFGGVTGDNEVKIMEYAWNWAAVQLDNGTELSVATLIDPRCKPHKLMETRAIIVDKAGGRSQPTDLEFTELNSWTSVRSFNNYPTKWRVSMPSAGVDLSLAAPYDDQEFVTLIARPGFWEGRVDVTGTVNGQSVTGVGYIERNGFTMLSELDGFFKAVGKETRRAVQEVYPDTVDRETAITLIATPDTPWYVDGVDFDVFKAGIIDPVRYISDQGGKSWRSYGALACMDVVGGDSRKYVRWLSMPEFMHVGSLIVDDIEDRSTKRRGADCAHIRYGEPIAINAGTAAYFQGQQMLLVPGLTPTQLNQIYDFYFAALRAGHAGQALDIAGLGYLMDDVLERSDGRLAEDRLLAIHRLKTAVPAASLARMGALIGGGSKLQIEAVGRYYESVGTAFQIMDDVLNLRGLYTSEADKRAGVQLKTLGEDITAGKVTFPVVKAISRLSKEEMRALWETIRSKPEDPAVVQRCIDVLEACGAIEACVQQSQDLVESAFKALDPVVPDSFSKIMLRSFGWFVTERQH